MMATLNFLILYDLIDKTLWNSNIGGNQLIALLKQLEVSNMKNPNNTTDQILFDEIFRK